MTHDNALTPHLRINRLALAVKLGWEESERKKAQTVFLDMLIQFPTLPLAAIDDDLQNTICYQKLITELREHLQNMSFRLLEHLTYEVYQYIKKMLAPTINFQITMTKYPAIEGLTEGVSFTLGQENLS